MMRFGWHLPDDDVEFSAYLGRIKNDSRFILDGRVLYQPFHLYAVNRYFKLFAGNSAVDVGAHIGFWSYLLCRKFRKVYAFEPNARMRSLFTRNIAFRNVELFPVALSDGAGRGTLQRVAGNSGASFMNFGEEGEVECRTLDSYGLKGVGFIKIDVEGGEFLVLKGAQQTIRDSKPLIIVEQKLGARFGSSPEDIRRFMGDLGYVVAETVLNDEIFVPAQLGGQGSGA